MNADEQKEVLTGTTIMAGATVVATFLNFLRGIVIARFLGPSIYGVWQILMIVYAYGNHAHLGLLDSMNKRMPYLYGQGDYSGARKVKNATFWLVLLTTTVFCTVLMGVTLAFNNRLSSDILTAGFTLCGVIYMLQLFATLASLLRTDGKFKLLGEATCVLSLVSLVSVVLLLFWCPNKLMAAALGLLIGHAVANMAIIKWGGYRFSWMVDKALSRELFAIGLPLILVQVGYYIFITIDKWMIASMIGGDQVGYYGLGSVLSRFLFSVSSMAAFSAYPAMLRRFGKNDDPCAAASLVTTTTLALSFTLGLLCPLACLITPLLISYVLPNYVSSITCAIVLILGNFFLSLMTIPGNYLVSINKERRVFLAQITTTVVCVVLNYYAIKNQYGIVGVSVGTGFSFVLYATVVIWMSCASHMDKRRMIIWQIIKLYIPFLVGLGSLFAVWSFYGPVRSNSRFWIDAGAVLTQGVVVSGLMVAIFAKPVIFACRATLPLRKA